MDRLAHSFANYLRDVHRESCRARTLVLKRDANGPIFGIFLGLLLVAGGILACGIADLSIEAAIIGLIVAGVGLLFFVTGICVSCDRGEKLQLDAEGMTDFRSRGRRVNWDDIASAKFCQLYTNGSLSGADVVLSLRDGEEVTVCVYGLEMKPREIYAEVIGRAGLY